MTKDGSGAGVLQLNQCSASLTKPKMVGQEQWLVGLLVYFYTPLYEHELLASCEKQFSIKNMANKRLMLV